MITPEFSLHERGLDRQWETRSEQKKKGRERGYCGVGEGSQQSLPDGDY